MLENDVEVFLRNISKFIIETCKEKNITLDTLTKSSGIKKSKIKDILLLKEKDPNVILLIKISHALQITPYELFEKNDPRSQKNEK